MIKLLIFFIAIIISTSAEALSTGTAFAVTKDGYLITNYHVIDKAKTVIVRDKNNAFYIAEIIDSNEAIDLALLKINKVTPDFFNFANSETVKKGEKVLTIGFPHVDLQGAESKVTEGIINSLSGFKGNQDHYQISAEVQSGNSGGPLIRSDGTVVGVVASKLSAEKILNTTGDLTQNVNYAIKIDRAVRLFPNHLKYFSNRTAKTKNTKLDIDAADKAVYLVISSELLPKSSDNLGLIKPYIQPPKIEATLKAQVNKKPIQNKVTEEKASFENPKLSDAELAERGIKALSDSKHLEAISFFEQSAELGNVTAQYYLGHIYKSGNGTKVDLTKSRLWLEKASIAGNENAQVELANIYFSEANYPKAKEWFTKASEKNVTTAQRMLGIIYAEGLGTEKDYKKSMDWYRKAAAANDSFSETEIGYLYKEGLGVKQDLQEAYKWYQKSADKNNQYGQLVLGWFFQQGLGVPVDYKNAYVWYLKSAQQNNHIAQGNIASLYLEGLGVSKNHNEALKWYLKSAEQNNAISQFYAGWLYQNSTEVGVDMAKAVTWYEKSAISNAKSQYQLAKIYQKGVDAIGKDTKMSIYWFEKSAENGFANAQIEFAVIYLKGDGVPRDCNKANYWIANASKSKDLHVDSDSFGKFFTDEGCSLNLK